MIEFLFLDLDDTILDFHKAERIAIAKTIRDFGVEPTEEILQRYHVINKWHWEQLELGKAGAAEVIEAAGFDANVRGETLSIPEFARIANEIVKRRNG